MVPRGSLYLTRRRRPPTARLQLGLLSAATAAAAAATATSPLSPWRAAADGTACQGPTPLAARGGNVLLIGDSISMGSSGYSLFDQDMLQTATGGALVGSLQHGGGFGRGGQMASSSNGAAKVAACMGNASGTLPPNAWSVVTYNAGLHDCDTTEFVDPAAYTANLRGVFETLKPAASAVLFVTTTPYDVVVGGAEQHPAGINMSCVVRYNAIAREVAAEVGGVEVLDLHGYVESFCAAFPRADPALFPDVAGNYTSCAVQTTGLHFFNTKPAPSGQQFTALAIARAAQRRIPEASIANDTAADDTGTAAAAAPALHPAVAAPVRAGSCGSAPAPLSAALPNVLVIGDSISEPGSGYGPGVAALFGRPGAAHNDSTRGALASVQHNGGAGSNQAGPTPNGVACMQSWLGAGNLWDVITLNFGIHDCCPGGDGRPAGQNVPRAAYLANLAAIYAAASKALAPGGKIVWVSTTPVRDDGSATVPQHELCNMTGAAFNGCIDDYNAGALALLGAKPDVEHLDLNAAVRAVCGATYGGCNLQRWENVHFTDAGKQFCAIEVAAAVAPLLGPKWARLTPNATSA